MTMLQDLVAKESPRWQGAEHSGDTVTLKVTALGTSAQHLELLTLKLHLPTPDFYPVDQQTPAYW